MHRLYPVFVPHLGCPHQCVFCDQHTIAGVRSFDPALAERALGQMLEGKHAEAGDEIAFFGGSFTGIDRDLLCRLLDFAAKRVASGQVSGIRLSTRPDLLSDDRLAILASYPVTTIELGVQSLSDRVLTASGRGHSAADSERAILRLKALGYRVIGQMMVALPRSEREDERMTASRLCALGVDGARIYPTVVFPDTPLARMMKQGQYHPLTPMQAASRSADLLECFLEQGVPVIRIGLCSTEVVRKDGIGFHDAIGEMAYSLLYQRRLEAALSFLARSKDGAEETRLPKAVRALVPKGHISMAVGQKRFVKLALEERFSIRLRYREDETLMPYSVRVEAEEANKG